MDKTRDDPHDLSPRNVEIYLIYRVPPAGISHCDGRPLDLTHMHFERRRLLILLLVFGQIAVLFAGLWIFDLWLDQTLQRAEQERATVSLRNLAVTLSGRAIETTKPGAAVDWQSLTSRTLLEDGAYLCVTDAFSNRVMAHRDESLIGTILPALPDHANPAKPLSSFVMESNDANTVRPKRLIIGDELIVPVVIEGGEAVLRVHQPVASINARTDSVIARVRGGGAMMAMVLTLISGLVSWRIARRYESRVQQANTSLEAQVRRRTRQLERNRDAVIFAVARVAESRDEATGQHLERISHYTRLLAEDLAAHHDDLDENWVHTVATTSILHDVGKVGIPDEVLLKPGPLTDVERTTIQRHAYIGGDTLQAIREQWGRDPFLDIARQIVLGHHERWDGGGYPLGMAGEEIPLPARVVALADVYDALTSVRPYKAALSHEETKRRIIDGAGSQFDPGVVASFQRVSEAFDQTRQTLMDRIHPTATPDSLTGTDPTALQRPSDPAASTGEPSPIVSSKHTSE